jgi:hypothetical protein
MRQEDIASWSGERHSDDHAASSAELLQHDRLDLKVQWAIRAAISLLTVPADGPETAQFGRTSTPHRNLASIGI